MNRLGYDEAVGLVAWLPPRAAPRLTLVPQDGRLPEIAWRSAHHACQSRASRGRSILLLRHDEGNQRPSGANARWTEASPSAAPLIRSTNFSVRSLGVAAVLGELTCLFAAVLVLPATLAWLDQNRPSGGATIVSVRPPRG